MSNALPGPGTLTGWGQYPKIQGSERLSEDLVRNSADVPLARGLARSYGDASLPPAGGVVAGMRLGDRILAFDEDTGVLTAEAGLSLHDLAVAFLPRGWFTPVSTGTRYVTLGGMVASDIHGKNHHVSGCFGEHVTGLKIRTGAGEILDISPTEHPELFAATLGGQGLTGHIVQVSVRLKKVPSPWLYEETERYDDLDSILAGVRQASTDFPMTVCWIDTSATDGRMARGIVMRGRWAEKSEAPRVLPSLAHKPKLPFSLPSGLANPATIGLANDVWFRLHGPRGKRHVVPPGAYFWILDSVRNWNLAYGKSGFTQYQCVMPSDPVMWRRFLQTFQALGGCSFVTVFKDCGPAGTGMMSFPQTGTSIALDIPITSGTPTLIRALNRIVIENGGRVYLAKDAYTNAEELRAMYPKIDAWKDVRRRYDPEGRIRSAMSARLGLDL
jgi:decaprenylphospho-beta-D-ribofuranose 2-oxidase